MREEGIVFKILMLLKKIFCDIGEELQILFQDPATPYMIGINELHDKINYYLIIIINNSKLFYY